MTGLRIGVSESEIAGEAIVMILEEILSTHMTLLLKIPARSW